MILKNTYFVVIKKECLFWFIGMKVLGVMLNFLGEEADVCLLLYCGDDGM